MILNYKNELIEIEIIRSKRTTLCLTMKTDGTVVVKAPQFITDNKIREIVEKKAEWIFNKRKEISRRESKKVKREYVNGATLPYLGEEVPIEIILHKKSKVELEEELLSEVSSNSSTKKIVIYTPNTETEGIQKRLKKWYKKQTMDFLMNHVPNFSQKMNVSYTSISIKSRKSQWGTCDTQGNLTFSWRLIMAPVESIDYVIVHELCHRKHMDHSKQFWGEVKKVLPNYKEYENWLNENSINLTI